ncbi:hypothetical protein GCM10027180_38070 [Microbulbifer echini]
MAADFLIRWCKCYTESSLSPDTVFDDSGQWKRPTNNERRDLNGNQPTASAYAVSGRQPGSLHPDGQQL